MLIFEAPPTPSFDAYGTVLKYSYPEQKLYVATYLFIFLPLSCNWK